VSSPDPRRWYALALLCLAFFMVILDAAIVVVALPSIEADLGFSTQGLQWVLSGYALTYGGLLLLGGRSADLLGQRRVFIGGLVLFTVASALCGFAWSDWSLIAARAIQGIGAAAMTPSALALIMTSFEEGAERNKALGIWGALGGVGASAGWLIGGPLTDGLGWEWIFFINIPVGLAVFLVAPLVLPESRRTRGRRRYDPAGALSVTGALFLVVYALVEAPEAGWASVQTLALLGAAGGLLVAFAAIEARSREPLVPLRIFRSRTLVGANAAMLLLGAVAFGMPFILTLYAQQVLGYSALKFGASSVVMPVTAAIGSIVGQAIVTRAGFRGLASAGMVLCAAGCLLLTAVSANGSYLDDILPGLLVFGPGIGAVFVTASIATLAGVRETEAGLASGLNNTSFQLGAAIGIATVTTVAVSRTEDVLAAGASDPLVALTEGFQSAFAASAVFALAGLVVVLLFLGRPRRAVEAQPVPEMPA
jgi:EmrB/QacA subfamily drug resistance transporter